MASKRSAKKRSDLTFSLLFGICLVTLGFLNIASKKALTFDYQVPEINETKSELRVSRIIIDKLAIDLAVEESDIINGVWQISENGASHLSVSATPGSGSNVVIYAHNKNHLFGPITEISKGDLIVIETLQDQRFVYQTKSTHIVSPNEIEYVLPTESEELTIYTCTGLFDSKRFVVKAIPFPEDTSNTLQ